MLRRETRHVCEYVCGLVSAFCVISCRFVIGWFADVCHIGWIWSHICDTVRIWMRAVSVCWNSSTGLQYLSVWSRSTVFGLMMAFFLGQLTQHVEAFGFCWQTCWGVRVREALKAHLAIKGSIHISSDLQPFWELACHQFIVDSSYSSCSYKTCKSTVIPFSVFIDVK